MTQRNIRVKIEKALARSPVVLLTGARQTGKSTLVQEIGNEKGYHYVSFDDVQQLSAALADPIGFINGLPKPVVLDEVQRFPELFLTIKRDVDQNRMPGRYLLTGSANPLLIPRLGDSLAGRMEIFNLFPLSQGEINGTKEDFVDMLFDGKLPKITTQLSQNDLYKKIDVGGYPSIQNFDEEGRDSWFNGYITTTLQRDVKDLAQIEGLADFPRLLQLLATRVGNLINVADLARAIGLPNTTLHRYLTLLETIFITSFQRAWTSNLGNRLVKSQKIYLVDSGLAAYLLGVQVARASNYQFIGGVLENFVVGEINKQISWCKKRIQAFHYRTLSGIEVDIVLEDAAGNIVGIEVKNAQTVYSQNFNGLKYLQQEVGEKFIQGIVVYTGSQSVPFGDKLHALPVHALWS